MARPTAIRTKLGRSHSCAAASRAFAFSGSSSRSAKYTPNSYQKLPRRSRSGKRLIVSVADGPGWDSAGQVELAPEQVDALRRLLTETVVEPPGTR